MKIILKNINYKLFIALLIMGLCPTIYTTVRVFYLGNLPGEWSFSIAGQLTWVNLIYEIINEAIILPLFYFVGKVIDNKKELENRIKTGLIFTLLIYLFLTINLIIFIKPFCKIFHKILPPMLLFYIYYHNSSQNASKITKEVSNSKIITFNVNFLAFSTLPLDKKMI